MPQTRDPGQSDLRRCGLVETHAEPWRISDGVLFGIFISLLMWSLIVAGLHATLT